MHVPDPDSYTANTYIAAVGGAILGLRSFPGVTYREKIANLLCGFLLAVYAGPAVAEYLHVTSPRISAFIVFALGAGGLVLLGAITDGIKSTQFGAILTGWISRKGS